MLRTFFLSFAAFVGGAIAVYLVAVVSVLILWELTGYNDREGAGSMGLIFILGPGIALPAGMVAGLYTWSRLRNRARRQREAPAVPE